MFGDRARGQHLFLPLNSLVLVVNFTTHRFLDCNPYFILSLQSIFKLSAAVYLLAKYRYMIWYFSISTILAVTITVQLYIRFRRFLKTGLTEVFIALA
jgi:hypothetical protein